MNVIYSHILGEDDKNSLVLQAVNESVSFTNTVGGDVIHISVLYKFNSPS